MIKLSINWTLTVCYLFRSNTGCGLLCRRPPCRRHGVSPTPFPLPDSTPVTTPHTSPNSHTLFPASRPHTHIPQAHCHSTETHNFRREMTAEPVCFTVGRESRHGFLDEQSAFPLDLPELVFRSTATNRWGSRLSQIR